MRKEFVGRCCASVMRWCTKPLCFEFFSFRRRLGGCSGVEWLRGLGALLVMFLVEV